MRVIAGLGNPGRAYAGTRHNVGFWVVEALAVGAGLVFTRRSAAAEARGLVAGQDVILVKPLTFMNRSGPVLAALLAEHRIPAPDVIVVHDDLDLPAGRLRLKAYGGPGGHQGVLSIVQALQTDRFPRLKIGIGRPPAGIDPADYVLAPLATEERAVLEKTIGPAVEALECWVAEGLAAAMNRFNQPPAP